LSLDGSRDGSREVLSQDLSCGSRETLQERLSPAREVEQEPRDWLMASREQLCQTGSSSTDSGIQSVGEPQPQEESHLLPSTLVHRMWGGRMVTSYTCLTCSSTSSSTHWFTDLHLAIPSTPSSSPLAVPHLLSTYLSPETLDGDNQYQCDSCGTKRDAVKRVAVTSPPHHLNITLLRFKYDRETNRRAKVFTPVEYPHTLHLPVADAQVEYHLYSVVVHSGYSSDGGHYYTWARAADSGSWLVLNDSLVTEVSGEQFAQMARKTSSRDTAYLLLYERAGGEEVPAVAATPPARMARVLADNRRRRRGEEGQG